MKKNKFFNVFSIIVFSGGVVILAISILLAFNVENRQLHTVKLTLSKVELESQLGMPVDDFHFEKDKKNGGIKVFVKPQSSPDYIDIPVTIQRIG